MDNRADRAVRAVVKATHLLAMIAGVASFLPPAWASATPAAGPGISSTTCNPEIGVTHQPGSQIVGHSSLSNCPSRTTTARLTIQRHHGFTWHDDGSNATV
ncbi:MAG TPA: hypothetical protein VFC19_28620 [Candidatus Limnocylindrales bacterium]|nr:hypothetical protein [Candidatus Limnocylindrales bacterium]